MGARPLRRLLRTELEDKLAHELLFGSLAKGAARSLTLLMMPLCSTRPVPR